MLPACAPALIAKVSSVQVSPARQTSAAPLGAGGVLVELLKDVAVRLAPVSPAEAREMLLGLRVAPLLKGFRGSAPLDLDALADTVSRVSWLAHDLGDRFGELDVNPVLVGKAGQGCTGVDARLLMNDD